MQTVPHITPRAATIMDFVIQGMKSGEIAERLGLSLSYVSTVINAPQFSDALAIRRGNISQQVDDRSIEHLQEAANESRDADRILREHARKAAENMARLADGDNDSIALRANADILDRVGPQKRTGVDATQTIVNIDINAAMLIKETLEMDKAS